MKTAPTSQKTTNGGPTIPKSSTHKNGLATGTIELQMRSLIQKPVETFRIGDLGLGGPRSRLCALQGIKARTRHICWKRALGFRAPMNVRDNPWDKKETKVSSSNVQGSKVTQAAAAWSRWGVGWYGGARSFLALAPAVVWSVFQSR